jgi:phospho-N-acetylmuramoyl-pentapeptide-transferase
MLFLTFLLCFLLGLMLLNFGLKFLKTLQKNGQPIREDGPISHFNKAGTPTMGGIIFIPLIAILLLMISNGKSEVLLLVVALLAFGAIGFFDDYNKINKNNSKGLSAKMRLFFEILIACILVFCIQDLKGNTSINIPFHTTIDLGWFYYPLASLAIIGSANATNLTDGLDGLLIGSVVIILTAFLLIMIRDFPSLIEMQLALSVIVGIALSFLWYNAYPAKIFMGDTGSLALGATIGLVAVLLGYELFLVVMGGLYVAEALSVILQVIYYKKTGRRVFLMAPLHHHFEKKGIAEPLLVVRLWIVHLLLVMFGFYLSNL